MARRRRHSVDALDFAALRGPCDVHTFLRHIRLHKYSDRLNRLSFQQLLSIDESGLERLGMHAKGARTRLLKAIGRYNDYAAERAEAIRKGQPPPYSDEFGGYYGSGPRHPSARSGSGHNRRGYNNNNNGGRSMTMPAGAVSGSHGGGGARDMHRSQPMSVPQQNNGFSHRDNHHHHPRQQHAHQGQQHPQYHHHPHQQQQYTRNGHGHARMPFHSSAPSGVNGVDGPQPRDNSMGLYRAGRHWKPSPNAGSMPVMLLGGSEHEGGDDFSLLHPEAEVGAVAEHLLGFLTFDTDDEEDLDDDDLEEDAYFGGGAGGSGPHPPLQYAVSMPQLGPHSSSVPHGLGHGRSAAAAAAAIPTGMFGGPTTSSSASSLGTPLSAGPSYPHSGSSYGSGSLDWASPVSPASAFPHHGHGHHRGLDVWGMARQPASKLRPSSPWEGSRENAAVRAQ